MSNKPKVELKTKPKVELRAELRAKPKAQGAMVLRGSKARVTGGRFEFTPVAGCLYRHDYRKICGDLNWYKDKGDEVGARALMRKLCRGDLFFLMYFVLGMKECNHPWIVERIKDVERRSDRVLDLWARGHWKSNIRTYAHTIQKILNFPEKRYAILSETRQIAKAFLRRIKTTFEQNVLLRELFRDVLYDIPDRQSPKWSEDEGLTVIRQGTYFEATLEAWGLDSLPTGKHYDDMLYDDLVSEKTISSGDMIEKYKNLFELSFGLETTTGHCDKGVIGTIYHFADLNQQLSESGEWFVRKHPAEDAKGVPVLMTQEQLAQKRKDCGSYVFACQYLINPIELEKQTFRQEWVRYFTVVPEEGDTAIFCDPADASEKRSDSTVFAVIKVDPRKNYFLLDIVKDKLALVQRWETMKGLVKKWGCRTVHYEVTGQGRIDVQYYNEKMRDESFYFDLVELKNMRKGKEGRIASALQPLFEAGRFFLPHAVVYYNNEGTRRDLIHDLIADEYMRFPAAKHDDMLDCISMCKHEDSQLKVPETVAPPLARKGFNALQDAVHRISWMAQ